MKTAKEIIELVVGRIEALEDGAALAALGISDADQTAVEEAHAMLSKEKTLRQHLSEAGAKKTPAKTTASRENGKKGGRPSLVKIEEWARLNLARIVAIEREKGRWSYWEEVEEIWREPLESFGSLKELRESLLEKPPQRERLIPPSMRGFYK